MNRAALATPERVRAAPRVAPNNFSATPLVPRDLVVRVGRLAGFAVYYDGGTPYYKERSEVFGERGEVECEFNLPHVAFRIMSMAPRLLLERDGAGYSCSLKAAQMPQHGDTLIEAVFRAFADAKSNAPQPS